MRKVNVYPKIIKNSKVKREGMGFCVKVLHCVYLRFGPVIPKCGGMRGPSSVRTFHAIPGSCWKHFVTVCHRNCALLSNFLFVIDLFYIFEDNKHKVCHQRCV